MFQDEKQTLLDFSMPNLSFLTHRKKFILCIDKVAILCELHYIVDEEEN